MKYSQAIVRSFFKEVGLPEPLFEYRFHPERKWRFDIAFTTIQGLGEIHQIIRRPLYIECDGGIWIRGGHNRGAQMKKDWEKRNAATILGWRGLWCEPKDLCTVEFTETIKQALKSNL